MEASAAAIRGLSRGKNCGRGGTNTLSFMQPLYQSTQLSLAISAAISTTRRHWLLHDRTITGEGARSCSEQPCGSEATPRLVGG